MSRTPQEVWARIQQMPIDERQEFVRRFNALKPETRRSECSHSHHQRVSVLKCAHVGIACIEEHSSGTIAGHPDARPAYPLLLDRGEFTFDTWADAEAWLLTQHEVPAT